MNSLKIKVANSARQFESTLNLAFTLVFPLGRVPVGVVYAKNKWGGPMMDSNTQSGGQCKHGATQMIKVPI